MTGVTDAEGTGVLECKLDPTAADPDRPRGRRTLRIAAVLALVLGLLWLARPAGDVAAGRSGWGAPVTSVPTPMVPGATGPALSPPAEEAPPQLADPDRRIRVAFFGDSIAVEAEPHLSRLAVERGFDLRFDGFGGTATCDYLHSMRKTAEDFDPDMVVLLFTGNASTPCMVERTRGERGILGEEGAFDLLAFGVAYAEDTAAAIEVFRADVPVLLVGVLPSPGGRLVAARLIDDLYRGEAQRRSNVVYVSAEELLAPGGTHVQVLPCTFVEPCTLGEPVAVRAEDGVHLCPMQGFCHGGLRMAIAIADAVDAAIKG